MAGIVLPAEWFPQSGVQVTWPHDGTDWRDMLEEVTSCYVAFSKEILKREKLLVVAPPSHNVRHYFTEEEQHNLLCVEVESNDTWARDHGAITVFDGEQRTLIDFGFNAWGLKFAAHYDNQISGHLFRAGVFQSGTTYQNRLNFILEGGSIESDGKGTLLTTSCLLAPNRNQPMTRQEIDHYLKRTLGAERVLWLNHGYLAGDDTDSHIDTLARFCDEETIAYVKCDDENDEHFSELQAMEAELKTFLAHNGKPYRLIPLPMAEPVFEAGQRLPATYANFLIINNAVLLPYYGTDKDEVAKQLLQEAFPTREIVGIDCRPLIKQHGSLHCVTMQFPEGVI
ncbi:MAG: agmatine deiminase family protein [Proteiniphilum sp.]|jgi:agmatine deiminase|nr:agmatine deiminase family protein [Proteiniphilum sp.]MDD3075535.1 agmatine deiminase family protein [Proteiniphilum sp.]MDD3957190.1 agmatine deiminase family protein [Proteiniphilum sp.]MDD4452691.1 agmatine deiminase family protein [Proteiniphilum sp.]